MSPVSRGRKPKKKSKSANRVRGPQRAAGALVRETDDLSDLLSRLPDGFLARSPERYFEWWDASIDQILAESEALTDVSGPRELEQAVAELVGGRLYQALAQEETGFTLADWLVELVEAVGDARKVTGADNDGAWYLLHGLAAIAPPPIDDLVRQRIDRLRAGRAADPGWLAATPAVLPTGAVSILHDGYRSRFGVLIGCRRVLGEVSEEHVYLLDVDTCTSVVQVVDAGVYDDVEAASAAWRDWVGPPADTAVAEPVASSADRALLAELLPEGYEAQEVKGGESRRRMDNYFRCVRRAADLAERLAADGRPLPAGRRWLDQAAVEPYQGRFASWYTAAHGRRPDPQATECLIAEWLEGTFEPIRLTCSPHRVANVADRLVGDWRGDPKTGPALALLPDWVAWCVDQTGLAPALAERALLAARAHVDPAHSRAHHLVDFGAATPE